MAKLKVAVLGSSGSSKGSVHWGKAFEIGRTVAKLGGILLSGGCPGLPHAAVLGACEAGGLTVAVSPAMNKEEHVSVYGYPDSSHVTIFTGMGRKGRNVVLVRSADACLFVGGGMGTLNEFTIAFDELGPGCAIGILTGSGGLSDELCRLACSVKRTPMARLVAESDPESLIESIFHHISR